MTQNHSVLIIEDDSNYYEPLKKSLTDDGFQVIAIVTRAQEAIELLKKQQFDILLIDLQLEDGTGMEILHYLNQIKETFEPYVIIITAFVTPQILTFCRNNNYFHYKKNDQYHPKFVVQHLKTMKTSITHQNITPKTIQNLNGKNQTLIVKIYHELDAYNINPKFQAKAYLVKIIHEILTKEKPLKVVLSHLYDQIAGEVFIEPKAIEVSISRLIINAFEGENKIASYCCFYNMTAEEVKNCNTLNPPTNRKFIFHIVEKINKL